MEMYSSAWCIQEVERLIVKIDTIEARILKHYSQTDFENMNKKDDFDEIVRSISSDLQILKTKIREYKF